MSNFFKRSFWGSIVFFLALPLSAQTGFRFVVWADATDLLQFVVTNAAQIRQLSVPPRFSLFIGDLYDTGFNLTAVAALRAAMDGDQTNSLSGTLFPVRGNHDIAGGTNSTTGWISYFDVAKRVSGGDVAKGVPGIGGSNYAAMPGYDSLTYSFDYQNSHFIGMDIPGDVTLVKTSQLTWLDTDLAAAELRGVQHAFLFWHGPVYACGDRHGGINAPASLIAVLNKHPIVSAIFGGHTHVAAWTHMYTNRIPVKLSPHQAGIQEMLLLSQLRGRCPEKIVLYGVIPASLEAGTELSPALQEKLPAVAQALVDELEGVNSR